MEGAVRINLITNWSDQKGLWRDGCLLEALLCSWGHQPVRQQYTDRQPPHPAGLNIFFETLRPNLFPLAPVNWWVPNPEWARPEDLAAMSRVDRVLCKTREAEVLFTPLTDNAVYLGFESEDRYDPSVFREARVLHIAGGSILKGTQLVLDAWERYRLPYPLTVVGDEQIVIPRQIPNVTYRLGWSPDEELKALQNSHVVHLCPSETEGWGHTLWEGMSCDALVLTTLQVEGSWQIQSSVSGHRCLAPLQCIEPEAVASLLGIWARRPYGVGAGIARAAYLSEREAFRGRFSALLPHP
jgi:hypothetical protein